MMLVVGTPYTARMFSIGKGATGSYSISPDLPPGLVLDTSTGILKGKAEANPNPNPNPNPNHYPYPNPNPDPKPYLMPSEHRSLRGAW